MIPNHSHFIDALREMKRVQIVYYSQPDAGTVDRECLPLDYGRAPGSADTLNRYWVWDPANTSGENPIGLLPDQIVSMRVLGLPFDPEQLQLGPRPWSVPRSWGVRLETSAQQPAEAGQPAAPAAPAAPAPLP